MVGESIHIFQGYAGMNSVDVQERECLIVPEIDAVQQTSLGVEATISAEQRRDPAIAVAAILTG